MKKRSVQCLIVGGGPAGLTAAIYLARFHLRTLIIDAGDSRASSIPCTRNHAGFPEGISGKKLLFRMRKQATQYGAEIVKGRVLNLQATDEGFVAQTESGEVRAASVLMATGVTNRRPEMDIALHAKALKLGCIRYCPICDGFEVTGKAVAVLGCGALALKEATFLRSYTDCVTIVCSSDDDKFGPSQRSQLSDLGITVIGGPPREFTLDKERITVSCVSGRHTFDSIYPAMGSIVHSELAAKLGADITEDGCIKVDAHQHTNVKNLYAAGDVVIGLDQISHAMGQAGVAATSIRNSLAERMPLLWRETHDDA